MNNFYTNKKYLKLRKKLKKMNRYDLIEELMEIIYEARKDVADFLCDEIHGRKK